MSAGQEKTAYLLLFTVPILLLVLFLAWVIGVALEPAFDPCQRAEDLLFGPIAGEGKTLEEHQVEYRQVTDACWKQGGPK